MDGEVKGANFKMCKDCAVLESKFKHLEAFVEITTLVNSTLDIHEIKERAIASAMKLTDSEAGSLLFVDTENKELFFDVASGKKGNKIKTVRLSMGQGIAGWVAENRLPLIIEDAQADARFYKKVDEKSGFVTRSMICVPVETKTKLIGVLQIINKRNGMFTTEDMVMIVSFSNQVAIAVENARLHEELKETFYETVHAFAETIEMRDPYTGGHTKRVMDYSLAIGRKMRLHEKELVNLRLAAILHDIGKIGVKDDVLLKPGKLTLDEFTHMRKHSEIGSEVLSSIRKLKNVIPGIKYHHERYDGSGYPEGLKEESIPVIARIIAVADAFDAMTTDRAYRKSLDSGAAIKELKNGSGTQFDPEVVKSFLEVYGDMLEERGPE
ncbi:MAG TPA: HD-GYP domain-containing protein [Dissulfurispiraceae bacterium]